MINSEKIKARAKKIGVRQQDLAKAMGIRQSTVNQKINNVRPMYLDEAETMAQVLKISNAELASYFFSADTEAGEMDEEKRKAAPAEGREQHECPTLTLKGCGQRWIRFLDPEWSEEQLRTFILRLWDAVDQILDEPSRE